MKKAVISNRIFIEYDEPLMDELRKQLTYNIPSRNPANPTPEIIQTYNRISDRVVSIPSGRIDLIPEEHKIIDSRVKVPHVWPSCSVVLRDSQQYVHDNVEGSCIINAPVSWGKTFTALLTAKKLGQKTLVVVHTSLLRDQWVSECTKIFGKAPSILGNGKKDWSKWLTIATVQTLNKVMSELTEEFGTLIIDECHHIPATTFKSVLDKSKAFYKIGLSGTVERKDGRHVIFNDYFGPIRFVPKSENSMMPEVLRVKTNIRFGSAEDFNAKNFAAQVSLLANNPYYIDAVVSTALEMVSLGHRILVVSERIDLLKAGYEATKDLSVIITGETKDRDEAFRQIMQKEKSILWGSINIFSEGVSVNILSCLIMAAQTNNTPLLTQLVGRVTRLYPDKLTPIVVDFSLVGKGVQGGARNRLLHYANCGYKIHTIERKYGNL